MLEFLLFFVLPIFIGFIIFLVNDWYEMRIDRKIQESISKEFRKTNK